MPVNNLLRNNIIANYASQIYTTAIGILLIPIYIKLLGSEAYGLIGFLATVQTLFNLLDVGLTPTISRESTRFIAGSISASQYLKLVRILEYFFSTIAILSFILLSLFSKAIAEKWLIIENTPLESSIAALKVIFFIAAMRWVSALYKGILTGSEKLVWLGIFNIIIATVRSVIIIPLLENFDNSVEFFFLFQALITLIELVLLRLKCKSVLPKNKYYWKFEFESLELKRITKFSLSIAFTSSIWILLTQLDKFIISGLIPLSQFGYFNLAVMVASSVIMISTPLTNAITPRLSKLYCESEFDELIQLYKKSSKLIASLGASVMCLFIFCSDSILILWTNNLELTQYSSSILRYYSIGNFFMIIAGLPYCLQYAIGNLKLHNIGSLIFSLILPPLLYLFITRYGAVGAGYAWILLNSLWLIFWTRVVHNKLFPNLHRSWLINSIVGTITPTVLLCSIMYIYNFLSENMISPIVNLFQFSIIILISNKLLLNYSIIKFKAIFATLKTTHE